MKHFPDRKEIGEMIKNDMYIHRVRSNNFSEFENMPNLTTHILVGLAELNSNSEMFGGQNSDSFKMKYKNFEKYSKRGLISRGII